MGHEFVHDLTDMNNHVVVVVRFGWKKDESGQVVPNNFVLTAYQSFF